MFIRIQFNSLLFEKYSKNEKEIHEKQGQNTALMTQNMLTSNSEIKGKTNFFNFFEIYILERNMISNPWRKHTVITPLVYYFKGIIY